MSEDMKIRVAMCDDAKFLCDGFQEQFALFSDLEFVGAVYSAAECPALLERERPDVLLLDIRMETEVAGIDVIPQIKQQFPDTKIIMLTSYNDDDYVFAAFANGADDYCEKTMPVDQIAEIIVNAYRNTTYLRPQIAKKLAQRTREVQQNQISLLYLYNKISQLSTGEYELLREMYYGASYKKIAEDKFVEIDSVRKMAKRVLKRMNARSMKDLIAQLHTLKIFEFMDMTDL